MKIPLRETIVPHGKEHCNDSFWRDSWLRVLLDAGKSEDRWRIKCFKMSGLEGKGREGLSLKGERKTSKDGEALVMPRCLLVLVP